MPYRYVVVLAATVGLAACAEQKPVVPSNIHSAQVGPARHVRWWASVLPPARHEFPQV